MYPGSPSATTATGSSGGCRGDQVTSSRAALLTAQGLHEALACFTELSRHIDMCESCIDLTQRRLDPHTRVLDQPTAAQVSEPGPTRPGESFGPGEHTSRQLLGGTRQGGVPCFVQQFGESFPGELLGVRCRRDH